MMKLYKKLNLILLLIFVVGTISCFQKLPNEIPLFMQSPNRLVFVGICFALLFALTIVSFFPQKISGSGNQIRNEITVTVLNLFGLGLFLFYFSVLARYYGLPVNTLTIIMLILGILMIFVGNLLPQMPFRSRIGVKLPWILKDKLCWQKTHRFAGYTAIPLGLLQCLLALFVSNYNISFFFGIGLWIIIVCLYSLFVYVSGRKN